MNLKEKYGSTALIAGASEGLGAAYAHALAAAGLDLILVARRKEPLEKTAAELRDRYRIAVTSLSCDLSEPEATDHIAQATLGTEISFMVYNAALSPIGPYVNFSAEEHVRVATVNMITPLKMLRHFGEKMLGRKQGGIVLMTSMAGLQGAGFIATYAATKAFNMILAESLWYEWKDKGVDVIGCCAGATATRNYLDTKPGNVSVIKPSLQSPEQVVSECLQKIGKTPSFISGSGNKFASLFMHRLIPRKLATRIMGDTLRKMYRIDY